MPFYGLDGFTGTITVGTRSKAFVNIGTAEVALAASTLGRKVAVIEDPTAPDSVSIVTQPASGRAIPRKDGAGIDVDLLNYDVDEDTDLTIVYDRVKNGSTSRVEATLTVSPSPKQNGWHDGSFYNLEVDANNRTIVEPTASTRRIYISTDGLSAADIVALEPSLDFNWQVTSTFLRDTTANGESYKYGETESLAIDQALAESLWDLIQPENNEPSPWLLWERGKSYAAAGTTMRRGRGQSHLHPIYSTSWGTGDLPTFADEQGPYAFGIGNPRFIVVQDIKDVKVYIDDGGCYTIIDNIDADQVADAYASDSGALKISNTVRRFKIRGAHLDAPKSSPTQWNSGFDDRVGNTYISATKATLMEDGYLDHAGWVDGYRADLLYDDEMGTTYPQPPTQGSHNIYQQSNLYAAYFNNIILSRAAFSGGQLRSFGICQDLVGISNNGGFLLGEAGSLQGSYTGGNANSYSFGDQLLTLSGGFRGFWDTGTDAPSVSTLQAGGYTLFDPYAYIGRSVLGDIDSSRSDIAALTGPTVIGPCGVYDPPNATIYPGFTFSGSASGLSLSSDIYDFQVFNWGVDTDDFGVDSIDSGVLDGTTIGAFNDFKASTTGSEMIDYITRIDALDAPWEEAAELIRWVRNRLGNSDATLRSVAQTVTFAPQLHGMSPANQAYINVDWDTLDRPGTVDGDSVDLDGHSIAWNITPKNSIDNFTFGAGATCRVVAGILEPTGDVIVDAGGNTLTAENGGKAYIHGYSGSGSLLVDARSGRFMNKGAVAGNVSLNARYMSEVVLAWDAGAFTLSSGETLTVYGRSKVGFDGTGAGAVSLTLASGSTLAFKPTIKLAGVTPTGAFRVPKEGFTVTGDTSGATGTVRELQYRSVQDWMAAVDDLDGVFENGEDVSGVVTAYVDESIGHWDAYASLRFAPTYLLGTISEFITGVNGYSGDDIVATDVASTVNLGGTLHLDVNGVANGTYTLIDVDTVSGTFDAVTAENNSAKDLTISITGTTVTVLVEDGDGTVTGGTS